MRNSFDDSMAFNTGSNSKSVSPASYTHVKIVDVRSTSRPLNVFEKKQLEKLTSLLKKRPELYEDIPLVGPRNRKVFIEKGVVLGHEMAFHRDERGIAIDKPNSKSTTYLVIRAYFPGSETFLSFHYTVKPVNGTIRKSNSYECSHAVQSTPDDVFDLLTDAKNDISGLIKRIKAAKGPRDITSLFIWSRDR